LIPRLNRKCWKVQYKKKAAIWNALQKESRLCIKKTTAKNLPLTDFFISQVAADEKK
jgi:hypothetical protein